MQSKPKTTTVDYLSLRQPPLWRQRRARERTPALPLRATASRPPCSPALPHRRIGRLHGECTHTKSGEAVPGAVARGASTQSAPYE